MTRLIESNQDTWKRTDEPKFGPLDVETVTFCKICQEDELNLVQDWIRQNKDMPHSFLSTTVALNDEAGNLLVEKLYVVFVRLRKEDSLEFELKCL